MNKLKKIVAALGVVVILGTGMTACSTQEDTYQDRKVLQEQTTLENSIALENLKKKRDLENDPNKVRYIYLMNFGQIVGYYVSVGNITSNASQMAPEQEAIRRWSTSDDVVVDSAADDGTYGAGDPGIFFFTADGTMVVTSLDYIQSDQPLQIDVPRLGGE